MSAYTEYKPTQNEQKLIDIYEGITGFGFPPEFVTLEDGCRALREVFNAGALSALESNREAAQDDADRPVTPMIG